MLRQRYEDPLAVINASVENVLNESSLVHAKGSPDWRRLGTLARVMWNNIGGENSSSGETLATILILRCFGNEGTKDLKLFMHQVMRQNGEETVNRVPKWAEMMDFIHQQEMTQNEIKHQAKAGKSKNSGNNSSSSAVVVNVTSESKPIECFLCKGAHRVVECSIFQNVENKVGLMREKKLCIFCAGHRWSAKNPCKRRNYLKCGKCDEKHITELHVERVTEPSVSLCTVKQKAKGHQALLPTALVNVVLDGGEKVKVRVILDHCSQKNLIAESLVQKLGLKKVSIDGGQRILGAAARVVSGLGSGASRAGKYVVNGPVKKVFTNHKSLTVLGTGASIGVSVWEGAKNDEKIELLKHDIDRVRAIQSKTASHILKMEDVKYEAIENQFDEIKKEEKLIQLETEINAFESSMLNLIEEMRMRYEAVETNVPENLLSEQIEKVSKKFPDNKIIISGSEVKGLEHKKSMQNGYLVLQWEVPLVKLEPLELVAFVSIPGRETTTIIEKGKLITRRVIDRKRRLEAIYDSTSYVETEDLVPMSNCTVELLSASSSIESCNNVATNTVPFIVESLTKRLAVVMNVDLKLVELECDSGNFISIKEKFALIDHDNCSLLSERKQILTSTINAKVPFNDLSSSSFSLLNISEFKLDKRIGEMRQKVIEDIDEMENFKFSVSGGEGEGFLETVFGKVKNLFCGFAWEIKMAIILVTIFLIGMGIYLCMSCLKKPRRTWEQEIIELTNRRF